MSELPLIMACAALPALLSFALSAWQASVSARAGSDQSTHRFLINALRRNDHSFFTRIPGLLNEVHCAALPLYLHRLLSYLPPVAVDIAARFLNPIANAAHSLVVFVVALMVLGSHQLLLSSFIALIFALTPQFFHAFSARNFGLSARSVGLLLLTIFLALTAMETEAPSIAIWLGITVSAYLIWAFSTFAAQAAILMSVAMASIFGHIVPIMGMAAGLALFVAVHPRYSLAYLWHTLKFIYTYATLLSQKYILSHRFSIWRDLWRDIWQKLARNRADAVKYAYGNSVLIVVLLNPAFMIALISWLAYDSRPTGIEQFAGDLTISGGLIMLLTSFRPTRFLGEPERYVEAAGPWAALGAGIVLFDNAGLAPIVALNAVSLILVFGQLIISYMLARHMKAKPVQVDAIWGVIAASEESHIRCASNNEDLTKMLLRNDWEFAFYMAAGEQYAGMTLDEAFSEFPILHRHALERIAATYRVNICVLDRSKYDSVFEEGHEHLIDRNLIFQTSGTAIYHLRWATAEAA